MEPIPYTKVRFDKLVDSLTEFAFETTSEGIVGVISHCVTLGVGTTAEWDILPWYNSEINWVELSDSSILVSNA
jgi:hypothetical protein